MDEFYDKSVTIPLISDHGIPKTKPDTRKSYQKKLALYIILLSVLFERIAFYSIASDISFTLQSNQTFNWTIQHASIASYIFSGTSYLFTLIFAIISDAKLGRAWTIFVGFLLYSIGYTLVTVIMINGPPCFNATHPKSNDESYISDEFCSGWILGTLIIIAIGSGAVKSNMVVFGFEQIQESKLSSRYFYKYALAVNIGASIEIIIVPYFQSTNDPSHEHISYIFATSALGTAFFLFLIGWKFYIHPNLNETVVVNCIPVIINAYKTRHQHKKNTCLINREQSTTNLENTSNNLIGSKEVIRDNNPQPSGFLDFAKAIHNGKYQERIVDDVKSLRNGMIVFSLLIPYWLVHGQVDTGFPMQAEQMYVSGSFDSTLIAAWISVGESVTIVFGVLISFLFVNKHIDAKNLTTRLVIGMLFACLSMIIAGIIEIYREKHCNNENGLSCLSIYFTIPQNMLLGLSQIFALVASWQYAYFASPRSAQALFMSLHFCSLGISSFIGAGYVAIFSFIAYESNHSPKIKFLFQCLWPSKTYWTFYSYFFVLAGLQLLFTFIFIYCQKKFKLIQLNPQQKENKQVIRY